MSLSHVVFGVLLVAACVYLERAYRFYDEDRPEEPTQEELDWGGPVLSAWDMMRPAEKVRDPIKVRMVREMQRFMLLAILAAVAAVFAFGS